MSICRLAMAFPHSRPDAAREPVLKKFDDNTQCRDAVFEYDVEPQPAHDTAGKENTVGDRSSLKTLKTDMVTRIKGYCGRI
jgi:hypothetical protein